MRTFLELTGIVAVFTLGLLYPEQIDKAILAIISLIAVDTCFIANYFLDKEKKESKDEDKE